MPIVNSLTVKRGFRSPSLRNSPRSVIGKFEKNLNFSEWNRAAVCSISRNESATPLHIIVLSAGNVVKVSEVTRKYHTIVEPVADLRKIPGEVRYSCPKDDLLLSQLLFGEKLIPLDEKNGWVLVEAVEQLTFRTSGRWEGYSGWVKKESIGLVHAFEDSPTVFIETRTAPIFSEPSEGSPILFELSLGTRMAVNGSISEESGFLPVTTGGGDAGWIGRKWVRPAGDGASESPKREDILATASLFLGVPYLWGGRSMYMPGLKTVVTGVDCSGLVNLVYRAHGVDVPRDAHEQWMKAAPLKAGELKPGDLVFVSRDGSDIVHVMLFAGTESFIEAHETGADVRIGTFGERFGVGTISNAGGHESIYLKDGRRVFFGSVLP